MGFGGISHFLRDASFAEQNYTSYKTYKQSDFAFEANFRDLDLIFHTYSNIPAHLTMRLAMSGSQ